MSPDVVLHQEVLVDPWRLGTPIEGPEGRPAVAVGGGKSGTLTVHLGPVDWRHVDQLVLPVWLAESDGARLTVAIRTGTQTAGLHTADQFHTWCRLGTEARFGRWGWQEVLLPYENFHIVGKPDGWRRVEALEVRVDGAVQGVYVGAVVGQRRRRPPGPRLTRRGLLDELDLARPELAAVREAAGRGDLSAAETALLDHFRGRTLPRHVFPRPARMDAAAVGAADLLLRHVILEQALPVDIDWRANPIGYLEWCHALNRHGWMRPLVEAYAHTRDERYAGELDALIRTWIEQSPAPMGHHGGGDPAWETLSTAVRIYGIWLDIWCGFQDSPSFRNQTRLAMLRSIWAHAEHLMEHGVTWHNNWEIVESEAIALIGLMFPEFRRAAEWREEGFRRLWRELERQVHDDGMQWELSPGYHMMSGQGFILPFQLAQMNGLSVPEGVAPRLSRMFDAIMHLTRPDGTLPSLNDSGGIEGSGAEWLRTGAALFDRPDWLWVASEGQEGAEPTAASHALDHAGLYVLRSGWRRDDRWLVFDGAPLGRSHQHEDKLSFELYAFGTRFLLDPGISSYMRDPWTDYFRSSAAHNTILIDGAPQRRGRAATPEETSRSVRGENLWAAGEVIDAVGSACDGPYGVTSERLTHRRWIVFVKPDYYLLIDEIAGRGTHRVDSLFHFAPMRLRLGGGQTVVATDRLGKPNLDILAWPQARGWRARIVTGQNDPVQGWITAGDRSILPAPVAILSRQGRTPIRSALVLVPYRTGTSSGVVIERLTAPAGCWSARVTLPDGRTDDIRIAFALPAPPGRGRLHTNGRFAVIRRDADGRPARAAVVEGTMLSIGRRALITSQAPQTLLEWQA